MQFNDFFVGQSDSSTRTITDELILMFANVSGDFNPVHMDEEYAFTTFFGKRIAHGMLISSFISALIGNKLPGNGSIYLGQNLAFKKPVYIGDTITTKVSITDLREEKHLISLCTECVNQNGEVVVQGDALVKFIG